MHINFVIFIVQNNPSSDSYHICSYDISNKDNIDNNKDFFDNNDRNVNQCQVHQDRKKIRRCEICFGVGHDRRNCPHARVKRE
uniref:Uncharacterized protein n=1 Tax=Lactuca sativa TaxID=4236 RepID=A0A9R1X3W8_LACSA|nr:hypothetical protein LSAT_V11C700380680 [Lactuca sativa]